MFQPRTICIHSKDVFHVVFLFLFLWLFYNEDKNFRDPALVHNPWNTIFWYGFDWETYRAGNYTVCVQYLLKKKVML